MSTCPALFSSLVRCFFLKPVVLGLLTTSRASSTSDRTRATQELVWFDEFDDKAIDEKKWKVLKGDGCDSYQGCGWGQGQMDVAQHQNAYTNADGHLVLRARQQQSPRSAYSSHNGDIISSARLSTFGSADFLYGRVEMTKDVANSATASVTFGDKATGCKSSDDWPHEYGGCSFSLGAGVPLSDDFHVYSLEWERNEFRWYLDGWHYCTKRMWGTAISDFPAPFDKAFHLEMALAVGGGQAGGDLGTTPVDLSALPQEMLVDYVRISQDPTGSWWHSPAGFVVADADERLNSSAYLSFLLDAIACGACVLGPTMAMTGLSLPRFNKMLMGVEIGAFKAVNAAYFVLSSSAIALVAAVLGGLVSGYLVLTHQALARWCTVGGLAVPVLFLLIDVGMISDMGSRYVCWSIFFVLTVTFAALAFPAENHALAFRLASAATGSCVLKLGVGRLEGLPGEIFKILDDPLGDHCYVSRLCRALTLASAVMFFIGLGTQCCLVWRNSDGRRSSDTGGYLKEGELHAHKPRQPGCCSKALPVSHGVLKSANDPRIATTGLAHASDRGTSPSVADARDSLRRAPAGARSGVLASMFRPFWRSPGVLGGVSARAGSPTPVPMPASGARSNTVVLNQGDTIELVVHSPNKMSLPLHTARHVFTGDGDVHQVGAGGGYEANKHREPPNPSAQRVEPDADESADALSVLSLSELLEDEPSSAATVLCPAIASPVEQHTSGRSGAGDAVSGHLATAYAQKWGDWMGDCSPGDAPGASRQKRGLKSTVGGVGTSEASRRSARDFDQEALLLSPYGSVLAGDTAPVGEGGDTPHSSDEATISSSSSTHVANHGDITRGKMTSRNGNDLSPASTVASGATPGSTGRSALDNGSVRERQHRGRSRSPIEAVQGKRTVESARKASPRGEAPGNDAGSPVPPRSKR